MAEFGWPTPDSENDNKRVVTDGQHEQIVHPGRTGLLAAVGAPAPIYADSTGLQYKIRGDLAALVRGAGWRTDSEGLTKAVSENTSGLTRVDLSVIRLDRTDRTVAVTTIEGTPGAGPPAWSTDGDYYGANPFDLPMGEITVVNGASTITAAQVLPRAWQIGLDGQIRCTETTRPPHDPGMVIWEGDRALISAGGVWRTAYEDTGWLPFAPATGWTSLQCRGRRRNGMVYLQLEVSRVGDLAAGVAADLATIPAALRPDSTVNAVGLIVTGTGPARIVINPTGLVRILEHSLQVGNTGFLLVNHSYPAAAL